MEERELRRHLLEAFRNMDQETRHISFEELAALASGKLSGPRSEEIEGHLAGCALCRQQLQEYEQFAADAQTPASSDLTDEWKELQRRLRPKKIVTLRRWLPPVAAALLLVAGLAWIGIDRIVNSPQRQLARVYHKHRPFDIRLTSASWGEVRVQRGGGSSLDRSVEFAEAKAKLQRKTSVDQPDPESLRLLAEAQMMINNAGEAIETLKHALNMRADDPDILADLGAAYALQSVPDQQDSANVTASNYLKQSLRLRPGVPQTMFNLALVLEHLKFYDQAIDAWQDYLNAGETDSGWRKEATDHLDDLRRRMKKYESAVGKIEDNPAAFLALPPESRNARIESYFGSYAEQWLTHFNSDQAARQAINIMADSMKQHNDDWLADILASGMGPEMVAGFKKLSDAKTMSVHKQTDNALAAAREASRIFLRANSPAARLRTRFLEVFFLHNGFRMPECMAASAKLRHDLGPYRYARMRARLELERSICAMRLANLDDAEDCLRRAINISSEAGFGDTALEAGNKYFSELGYIGLRSELFKRAEDLLTVFWAGSYEPYLFYQVADDMRELANRDGQKEAALFFARSAAWAAHAQREPVYEAPALANLAVTAEAVGNKVEAQQNLDLSDRLFRQVLSHYGLGPGTGLATVEMEHGDIDRALQRLESLNEAVTTAPSLDEVKFYAALGEAYRRKGWLPQARSAFRQSIQLGTKSLDSTSPEHAGTLKILEGSYKGLVAATLASPDGSEEALRIWQQYQALDGKPSREMARPSASVLSYVGLHDGFVAWLVHGDKITFRALDPKPDAPELAVHFLRRCSDPDTDQLELQRDARQLYSWMVQPFAEQLNALSQNGNKQQLLIVELDDALSGIPVQALISPDGRYLGERFLIMNSNGAGSGRVIQESFGRETRALVIADPAITGASTRQFPPLPDTLKEATLIHNTFSIIGRPLEGSQATISALLDWLPMADIVHFSGHGYVNGEYGALLFASPNSAQDYDPLRSPDVVRQDWSHVRLVVLSACAAAAGEIHGPHNPESLVRALTRAGAPRVIASLWNVDSAATLALMSAFYSSLGQGQSPEQALQTAQQKMQHPDLRHPEWIHPYYWAGFQLYGTT